MADASDDFLAVDGDNSEQGRPSFVRILVRSDGREVLEKVVADFGGSNFSIQLC